ncbi:MAG: DUF4328 domain-containing protein [Phycisphaeraceae bacterium]
MRTQVYADEYRSPKALGGWVVVTTIATYVTLLPATALDAIGRQQFPQTWDDLDVEYVSDQEALLATLMGFCWLLFLVVAIASIVFYFRWMYRAIKNSHALGVRGVAASPHGAWLWHLVPFANLVMPFRVMKQIALAAREDTGDIDHLSDPTPSRVAIWWAMVLLGGLCDGIASSMIDQNNAQAAMIFSAFSVVAGITSAVYLIGMVRDYSRMQDEKAEVVFARMEQQKADEVNLPPNLGGGRYRGL